MSSTRQAPAREHEPVIEPEAEPVLAADAAIATLARGPRGALILSAISVGLLFIGWLLFYFCLFVPRGAVD